MEVRRLKIKVKKKFRYEGTEYKPGDEPDLPDSVARDVINKGYAEKAQGAVEQIGESPNEAPEIKPGENRKQEPKWERKIWISENRNIQIAVWPPKESSKFNSPSISIQESKRQDDGSWNSTTIYVPTGSSALALQRFLGVAWDEAQEIKRKLKENQK